MSRAIAPYEVVADASTYLMTTLYDLMAALHDIVAPHEDDLVVAIVADWLRTDRITLPDTTAASRRLWRGAPLEHCHWGFPGRF